MACGSLARFSRQCWLSGRWLCARRQSTIAPAVNVADERVQDLLSQLTGLDLDKVFSARREPLIPPTYKLMTLEELEKAHAECVAEAKRLLRMPPILPERPPRGALIEVDDRLACAVKHRVIFTDTTQHKEDEDRRIVVREVDGTLREANWAERDRMCQLFFPKLGRKMWLPKMLHTRQLREVLSLGHHLNVLDVVCAQCAPDSNEYIRVHKTVYDDIEKNGLYEMLWSTRYFACLVWHLISADNITGLFNHMLAKERFQDAGGLVQLHLLCYPNSDFATSINEQGSTEKMSHSALVEAFCKFYELGDMSENVLESENVREQNYEHNSTQVNS